jgi:hypothetical protein
MKTCGFHRKSYENRLQIVDDPHLRYFTLRPYGTMAAKSQSPSQQWVSVSFRQAPLVGSEMISGYRYPLVNIQKAIENDHL